MPRKVSKFQHPPVESGVLPRDANPTRPVVWRPSKNESASTFLTTSSAI